MKKEDIIEKLRNTNAAKVLDRMAKDPDNISNEKVKTAVDDLIKESLKL